MIKPIVNTWTVFIVLIAINLLFLLFIKSPKKFYIGQISLFVLAVAFIFAWGSLIFPHYKDGIEAARNVDAKNNNGQISDNVWQTTEQQENFLYSINKPTFETVIIQTTLTFLFSLIGLQRTSEKKLFRRISRIFGILTAIAWFIYLIASIAPTGMVT